MATRTVTILLLALATILGLGGAFVPSARTLISPSKSTTWSASIGQPLGTIKFASRTGSNLQMSDSAAQPESQSIIQKVRG
jgi:hypothetical protein